MSERMTKVVAGGQSILENGHIDREEAVGRARRHWQRQLDKALNALDALDAGTERVYHQRGVHVESNQRELVPSTEDTP